MEFTDQLWLFREIPPLKHARLETPFMIPIIPQILQI